MTLPPDCIHTSEENTYCFLDLIFGYDLRKINKSSVTYEFSGFTSKSPVYLLMLKHPGWLYSALCTVVFSGYLKTVFQTLFNLYLLSLVLMQIEREKCPESFHDRAFFFNNSSSEHMIYRHWNCISKSGFPMDLRILAEGYFHRWCLYWLGLNYCFHSSPSLLFSVLLSQSHW